MSTPQASEAGPPRGIRISRRRAFVLGLFVVLVIYPVIVVVVPWALSLVSPRFGWTERGTGVGNWLGLIPVVAGIVGLVWVFSTMFAQLPKLPEIVELDPGERLLSATSRVLITHGPFAYSRNPMFLSGLIVWLGWALFYGSFLIAVLTVVLWLLSNFMKVPQEERGLEERFGEAYRSYQRRVPRWVGIIQRG
jgi:protein-S-isoprenylcysteine O-methyltransferase Ste14